jgi:hypothetical protein
MRGRKKRMRREPVRISTPLDRLQRTRCICCCLTWWSVCIAAVEALAREKEASKQAALRASEAEVRHTVNLSPYRIALPVQHRCSRFDTRNGACCGRCTGCELLEPVGRTSWLLSGHEGTPSEHRALKSRPDACRSSCRSHTRRLWHLARVPFWRYCRGRVQRTRPCRQRCSDTRWRVLQSSFGSNFEGEEQSKGDAWGKSLGVFPRGHPLRKICVKTCRTWEFDAFVLLVIFANCTTMGMETPFLDMDPVTSIAPQ